MYGTAMTNIHDIKECLKNLTTGQIKEVGLALGLLYPNLQKMSTLPEDMIQAWLQKSDEVLTKSGEPTVESLLKALHSSNMSGTADIVKSKFNL